MTQKAKNYKDQTTDLTLITIAKRLSNFGHILLTFRTSEVAKTFLLEEYPKQTIE